MKALPLALLAMVCSGCQSAAPQAPGPSETRAPPAARAAQPAAAEERRFGAPPSLPGEAVDVARVLSAPQDYLNRSIKCAGTVARVCQAAGCWLELRGAAQSEGLRVPMAGHAFFVPQDVIGKQAVVEGLLSARELNAPELAHLQGEGLKAIGPLSLAASSVVVR